MVFRIAHPWMSTRRWPCCDHPHTSDISRLLAAAVVNRKFRELLLVDPCQALDQGYEGENFSLTAYERKIVISIQAEDLNDFALQITSYKEVGLCSQGVDWYPSSHNALVLERE